MKEKYSPTLSEPLWTGDAMASNTNGAYGRGNLGEVHCDFQIIIKSIIKRAGPGTQL